MGAVGAWVSAEEEGVIGEDDPNVEQIDSFALMLIGFGIMSLVFLMTWVDDYPDLSIKATMMLVMAAIAMSTRLPTAILGLSRVRFVRGLDPAYFSTIVLGGVVCSVSAGVIYMLFVRPFIQAAFLEQASAVVSLLFYILAAVCEELFWLWIPFAGLAAVLGNRTVQIGGGVGIPGLAIGFACSTILFPMYHMAVYGTDMSAFFALLVYRLVLNLSYVLSGRILAIPILGHIAINVTSVLQSMGRI